MKIGIIPMVAIMLTGCDSHAETLKLEPTPAEQQAAISKANAKVVVPQQPVTQTPEPVATTSEELVATIEKAMSEIPPEMRIEFQKAFECFNKTEEASYQKQKKPRPGITGDTIRQITADLKAAGGKAKTC